jgi:hypothetical protein
MQAQNGKIAIFSKGLLQKWKSGTVSRVFGAMKQYSLDAKAMRLLHEAMESEKAKRKARMEARRRKRHAAKAEALGSVDPVEKVAIEARLQAEDEQEEQQLMAEQDEAEVRMARLNADPDWGSHRDMEAELRKIQMQGLNAEIAELRGENEQLGEENEKLGVMTAQMELERRMKENENSIRVINRMLHNWTHKEVSGGWRQWKEYIAGIKEQEGKEAKIAQFGKGLLQKWKSGTVARVFAALHQHARDNRAERAIMQAQNGKIAIFSKGLLQKWKSGTVSRVFGAMKQYSLDAKAMRLLHEAMESEKAKRKACIEARFFQLKERQTKRETKRCAAKLKTASPQERERIMAESAVSAGACCIQCIDILSQPTNQQANQPTNNGQRFAGVPQVAVLLCCCRHFLPPHLALLCPPHLALLCPPHLALLCPRDHALLLAHSLTSARSLTHFCSLTHSLLLAHSLTSARSLTHFCSLTSLTFS